MELMITKLLGFVLVLTRMSAFFLAAPVFSWRTIPVRVKVSIVMLLSVFFSMAAPSAVNSEQTSLLEAILLISAEALYGFALGLIVVLIFSAVKLSGRIIERQMGLAMAQTLDPLTGERVQPLGVLIELIFILLFLSANGHHLFLLIMSRSYETFPAGSIPTVPLLVGGTVKAGSTMFVACLRLAAPMLAAFLVLLVVLAVFARIMPDMNILFISMPLRVGLGLLMMGMFLPFINQFVAEFSDLIGKLLPL
ncbi:MAG: flagellar biosynthetic protein FliR [Planctomycetota bacterium]|nr:MAG: flagellar biosynthetic protein FliR [Planctomycetota bacterium]